VRIRLVLYVDGEEVGDHTEQVDPSVVRIFRLVFQSWPGNLGQMAYFGLGRQVLHIWSGGKAVAAKLRSTEQGEA
jgi:hypothetical protein